MDRIGHGHRMPQGRLKKRAFESRLYGHKRPKLVLRSEESGTRERERQGGRKVEIYHKIEAMEETGIKKHTTTETLKNVLVEIWHWLLWTHT